MKIKKPPGSVLNTYETEIEDLSSKGFKMKRIKIIIKFTSDERGEILSVIDPTTKRQITLPYEVIEQLVIHTRKMKKR